MYKILIKSSILIITLAYGLSSDISKESLALITLSALAISISIELICDKINEKIAGAIFISFFIASIFVKELVLVYPLVISSAYRLKKPLLIAPVTALIIRQNLDIYTISLSSLSYIASYLEDELIKYKENILIKEDKLQLDIKEKNKEKLQIIENSKKDIEIAILSERNRIARQIHDSVGHTISTAIIQAESMKILADDSTRAQIEALQNNLKSGMSDIRSSLHNLHEESLDLRLSLEKICAESSKIKIELIYDIYSELSYQAGQEIVSLTKECITNSTKHSNCDKMTIKILEMPKHISIEVNDNGIKYASKNEDKSKEYSKEYFKKSFNDKGLGFYSFYDLAAKYNGRFNFSLEDGARLRFILEKDKMIK